jgi:hypothetical protein
VDSLQDKGVKMKIQEVLVKRVSAALPQTLFLRFFFKSANTYILPKDIGRMKCFTIGDFQMLT